MKRNLRMLLLILFGLAASPLMAEQGAENITGNSLLGFTIQDIRELERLKDEDPTKFQEILTRRRAKIRKKLEGLRSGNPDEFKRVVTEQKARLNNRLDTLERKDFQRAQRINDRHHTFQTKRLERLKVSDPETFSKTINKRRRALDERLGRMQTHAPERYERIRKWRNDFDKERAGKPRAKTARELPRHRQNGPAKPDRRQYRLQKKPGQDQFGARPAPDRKKGPRVKNSTSPRKHDGQFDRRKPARDQRKPAGVRRKPPQRSDKQPKIQHRPKQLKDSGKNSQGHNKRKPKPQDRGGAL
jgi:hypothetical protein